MTRFHVLEVNSLQAKVRVECPGNPLHGAIIWLGKGALEVVGVVWSTVVAGAVLEG